MKVYDEGNSDPNELSLLKNFSSNYTLIIGKKFNTSNMNYLKCTIYITNRNLVSNFGLSDKGEDLIIQISNSTNISWTKDKDYSFEDGEIVFESQNEKTKLNSQYFILLGLSSLLGKCFLNGSSNKIFMPLKMML